MRVQLAASSVAYTTPLEGEAAMQQHLVKLAILGTVLVPILSTAPAQAQATRTWVSGVGDDVNPCSRTAPCKTFAGAISKTAAGGKINCLDPGGFGAVTITKSIEIDCYVFPGGILNAGSNGVNVNTAGTKVVLRGIEIHGAGTGVNGINITAGAEVTVDKCFIIAQSGNGINVSVSSGLANLIVLDTNITQAAKGIAMTASGGGAVIASIRNSNIFKVTGAGVELGSAATFATISHSLLTGNDTGGQVVGGAGQLNVVTSVISYNATAGLNAGVSGAAVRFADNNFFSNGASTAVVGGATLTSGGNNKMDVAGPAPGALVNQ